MCEGSARAMARKRSKPCFQSCRHLPRPNRPSAVSAHRLPLRHRSTIFPEDFNALVGHETDILITYEAPSCHRLGFSEIDDLAEIMGVKLIVHGHHRETCRGELPNGIRVIGVGKAEVLVSTFADLFARDTSSVLPVNALNISKS